MRWRQGIALPLVDPAHGVVPEEHGDHGPHHEQGKLLAPAPMQSSPEKAPHRVYQIWVAVVTGAREFFGGGEGGRRKRGLARVPARVWTGWSEGRGKGDGGKGDGRKGRRGM